jgi:hypothetical protein
MEEKWSGELLRGWKELRKVCGRDRYAIKNPPMPKLHAVRIRLRMISSVLYSGSSI